MNRYAWLLLVLTTASNPVYSQERAVDFSPDTAEAGSVEAIAEFTSEPRFLSPWVAYVPASDSGSVSDPIPWARGRRGG